ncbi:MAG: hypothetical protein ACOYJS_03360 [Acutalibacteraceae bacterium]|jgi:hypothetical protein
MLSEILNERKIPKLSSRNEMLDILQKEVYGYMPPRPDKITWEVHKGFLPRFCAGKAECNKVIITCTLGEKTFSFPFYTTIPTKAGKHPFFIHINFSPDIPDRYMPSEELIDNGFAILSFCYKDVTSDDNDLTNGLAGVLYPEGVRKPDDPGKIAMWSWAAQRVMDYAESELCDRLDFNCSVVCGHSRLGKTALLTGAYDQRFMFTYSNDSGCTGAALSRGNKGETVKDITERFPYWFCENYYKYSENEQSMPFDQHYLIASIAPRFALVGSAALDAWADPVSEMLACVAAGSAFSQDGKPGFVCEDRLPQIGDTFFEGKLGYHMRGGTHYFSREDWLRLIDFVNKHR